MLPQMILRAAVVVAAVRAQCPRVVPLEPIRERHDLGGLLRRRNLTGNAAELGVVKVGPGAD